MAKWETISTKGNVEDRRGMVPVLAGGGGILGVVLIVAFQLLSGGDIDVGDVLGQLENVNVSQQQTDTAEFEGADSYETFASAVLGSNNDMWTDLFRQQGKTYDPPKLVLFRVATESACGNASSSVGPHYCPIDETIYLDETFFNELKRVFGARGGDVAEAYVIAHEVGHHVQNKLGILDETLNSGSNEMSIKTELQADCFAGLWAYSIKDLDILEENEIIEAIDAAAAVGDDRIQEKVTGQVNKESWTHGSSEERVYWFKRGYETGTLSQCNTF